MKDTVELTIKDKAKIISEEFTWYSGFMSKWAEEDKWSKGRIETVEERWAIRERMKLYYNKYDLTAKPETTKFSTEEFTPLEVWKTKIYMGTEWIHFCLISPGFREKVAVYRTRNEERVLEEGKKIHMQLKFGEPIQFAGQDMGVIKSLKKSKY